MLTANLSDRLREMVARAPDDGSGGGGSAGDGDGDPRGDSDGDDEDDVPTVIKALRAERNDARRKAKEAARQNRELRSQLDELTSWKEEVEESKARDGQDFALLEKQLRKKLEDVTRERDELQQWKSGQETKSRSSALVEAIASKTGISNTRALRAALREAAEDGIEIAPENPSEVISNAVRAIKAISPELFSAANVGGSPGAGTNKRNKKQGEEPSDENDEVARVKQLAQSMSTGPQARARQRAAQQQE